jgi:hypothetical protein
MSDIDLHACTPARPGARDVRCGAGAARTPLAGGQGCVMPPGDLPLSIEDGARPPVDLTGYDSPLVVVIPFEPVTVAKKAA